MIIDFHTHVFPEKIAKSTISTLSQNAQIPAHYNGTKDGLLRSMEISGVDISVVLPVMTSPKQFESVNKFAKELNDEFEKTGKGLLSFGGIHPECEDIPQKIAYLKENGFKGVKIHPEYQNAYIDDPKYVEIIKCAKEQDLIVITHAGLDGAFRDGEIKCAPKRVQNLLKKVEYSKLVLAHYGGYSLWKEFYEILAGGDFYIDTAVVLDEIDRELFVQILEKHGEDKVLFATDGPWKDGKQFVQIMQNMGLSDTQLKKIMYKNAQKLLGI